MIFNYSMRKLDTIHYKRALDFSYNFYRDKYRKGIKFPYFNYLSSVPSGLYCKYLFFGFFLFFCEDFPWTRGRYWAHDCRGHLHFTFELRAEKVQMCQLCRADSVNEAINFHEDLNRFWLWLVALPFIVFLLYIIVIL